MHIKQILTTVHFCTLHRVLLCSSIWPETHGNSPASDSEVLGLEVRIITLGIYLIFVSCPSLGDGNVNRFVDVADVKLESIWLLTWLSLGSAGGKPLDRSVR